MKTLLTLIASVLTTGCICPTHHCPTPTTRLAPDTPTVIFMTLGGNFEWDGWVASLNDLPGIVSEHHIHSVILCAHKGAVLSYQEAQSLRSAFLAAGVKKVTIGDGGLPGE